MKYYDLLVSGSFTPQTVPTGGKALTEKFQPPAPTQPDTVSTQTNLSSATLKRTLCFPIMPSSHCPILARFFTRRQVLLNHRQMPKIGGISVLIHASDNRAVGIIKDVI